MLALVKAKFVEDETLRSDPFTGMYFYDVVGASSAEWQMPDMPHYCDDGRLI